MGKKRARGEDAENGNKQQQTTSTTTTEPTAPKSRILVMSNRTIGVRYRHLVKDFRKLLPHSKKEQKFEHKKGLSGVNDVCSMHTCTGCLFFENRHHHDLYMWATVTPTGPSVKFLVNNVHNMDELKMTGNCLLGSRYLLHFDANFDSTPHYKLVKEVFQQIFAVPKGHLKTKPFIDHMMAFYILDNRIWYRHYQIVDQTEPNGKLISRNLVEIGPRFVLDLIRIFEGSFGGKTLYENPTYVSPGVVRMMNKKGPSNRRTVRAQSNLYHQNVANIDQSAYELENVFRSGSDNLGYVHDPINMPD